MAFRKGLNRVYADFIVTVVVDDLNVEDFQRELKEFIMHRYNVSYDSDVEVSIESHTYDCKDINCLGCNPDAYTEIP